MLEIFIRYFQNLVFIVYDAWVFMKGVYQHLKTIDILLIIQKLGIKAKHFYVKWDHIKLFDDGDIVINFINCISLLCGYLGKVAAEKIVYLIIAVLDIV